MSEPAVALADLHRSAPSVSYPVGRSFVCMVVLVCATALAVFIQAALFFSWGLPAGLAVASWWASSLCWLLCLSWAWSRWRHTPEGWLSWSPETAEAAGPMGLPASSLLGNSGWWWSDTQGATEQPVPRVQPAMVFSQWMLLRVTLAPGTVRAQWMWVDANTLPPRWLALRRAVLAHAR